MHDYTAEHFDWETIKGRRVYGPDGALLGKVSEIEFGEDSHHMVILAEKRYGQPGTRLRIPTPMVGVIAERGVFLDHVSRWDNDEDDDAGGLFTEVAD